MNCCDATGCDEDLADERLLRPRDAPDSGAKRSVENGHFFCQLAPIEEQLKNRISLKHFELWCLSESTGKYVSNLVTKARLGHYRAFPS